MFDGFDEAQNRARGGDGWERWCGAAPWTGVSVPLVEPTGWSHGHIRQGLAELERVLREGEAAVALLVAALPVTRDSTADLARNNGISNREAKRRREIAEVVKKLPDALTKLADGEISAEHVAALGPVKDLEGAEKLLEGAGSKSPEAFAKEVEQFKLSTENGEDTAKRQWARRSFRVYAAADGMVGLSGLLPPLEGAEFRARLEAVRDAKWRLEHPERAETLGGHGGDTPEQRLADALLHLTGTPSENLRWPTQDPGGRASGASPKSRSATARRPDDREGEQPCEPVDPSLVDQDSGSARSSGPGGQAEGDSGRRDSGRVAEDPSGAVGDNCCSRLPGHEDSSGLSVLAEGGRAATPGPPVVPVSVKADKRAVVVVFNVDAWQAQLIGGGPVPVTGSLFDMARSELFYAFTNMTGEVLKFGRARRDPTPIQRLVVMARDQTCVYPGCSVPAQRTEVHHLNEYEKDQGSTDTDLLCLLCSPHHHHVHLNDLIMQRTPTGTIAIIDRETRRTIVMDP